VKKTVTLIVVLLVVIVAVTAYLNRGDLAEKQELQEEAQIIFTVNGDETARFNLAEIKEMGEVNFNKELDTSETGPEEQSFTGVLLKNVIDAAGITLQDKQQVIVKAVDGYTVALTADEVQAEDNVYLIYMNNGEFLKPKSEGGTGPYRIVIKEDQFGQRWCKFITEVELK